MKLQRLLAPLAISIISLSSQVHAGQTLKAYEPQIIPINSVPAEPKQDYFSRLNKQAVLEKKDEVLRYTEIKHKNK